MSRSYVVTGAGRGIGKAVAERLLGGGADGADGIDEGDGRGGVGRGSGVGRGGGGGGGGRGGGGGGDIVVAIERDPAALRWAAAHPRLTS